MKKLKHLLILTMLISSACNQNKIFEKHKKIKDYIWYKSEKIKFEVPVKDSINNYDICIAVRHITEYPFANLNTGLTIYYPNRKKEYNEYKLSLRDKDGDFKGDVLGNIWDISVPVKKNVHFLQKGIYKFKIENLMPEYEKTPGIIEIGLIIRKSEQVTHDLSRGL